MYRFIPRLAVGVATVLVLSVVFYGCLGSGLEVSQTNFTDVISPQQNLTFIFNAKVVQDSLLDRWDTTDYIKFTPDIKGQFKWQSPTELVFSPSIGFKACTDYKAEVTKSVLGMGSEYTLLGSKTEFTFHTPYLSLDGAETYWLKAEDRGGAVELRTTLKFNYDVNPKKIGDLLHLQVNNKDVPFVLLSTSVGKDVALSMQQTTDEFDDGTLKITVDAGAQCVESAWKSDKAFTLEAHVPSRKRLDITDVNTEFEEGAGVINVVTSQPVENSDVSSAVSINPVVALSVEKADFGLVLKGAFDPKQPYTITIKNTLRGVLGGVMSGEFTKTITFGELQPGITFTSKKALYLTPKGNRNIGVRIVAIPKVKVTIIKVFENNIQSFLRTARRYYYDDEDYYYDENSEMTDEEYDVQRTSSKKGGYGNFDLDVEDYKVYGNVISERTYETKSLPKAGNVSLLNMSLEDTYTEYKGIYVVKVESLDDRWTSSAKLVSVSDIGMIAKSSDNDVLVFCNSIKSAEPLSGVQVSFISTNNQKVQQVTTDGNGVAKFENVLTKAKNFTVGMITTRLAGDFNYMMFKDTKVETSRFDVGGMQENTAGLQAFVYGDRDVYRPGETIHLNTIVRDKKWTVPGQFPIKIKIMRPSGDEFMTVKRNLDKEGSVQLDVPIQQSLMTGNYVVDIYTANDVFLTSKTIGIEEFFPDRIDVKLNLSKSMYAAGDSVISTIHAVNYFGPPAALRNYEVQYQLSRKYFNPTKYAGYNFTVVSKNTSRVNDVVKQGKTDANGNVKEVFSVPAEYANTGMLTGKVFATVFDETGRPVSRMQTFDVSTQPVYYGIRKIDSYADARVPLNVPLVAVDMNGNGVSAQARVQVVRKEWQTVLENSGYSSFNYVSRKKEIVVSDKSISMGTNGMTFSYTPQQSGDYEIRVMKPDAETYVSRQFYVWGWGATQTTAFEVQREGQIDIAFDKPKYSVGEEASVLFKTPFAGKMLVTVERDGVKSYQYVTTDQKSASIKLKVTEDFLPNVYVTATLFKPLDDGAMPLTVAHGSAPLFAELDNTKIQLAIDAPNQSRSNTKQTIKVRAQNNSNVQMTIAVVDEGILAIKRTKTPNPHEYFYQRRALQVGTFDVYPYIFPELKPGKYSYGAGDDEYDRRLTPILAKRVNLVAFWSGVVTTNGSGEGSFTIDIPQFSGALRIMAVAYKGKSFGSAEKSMKVADPLVVSTGLPRFISPGDSVTVPVTLSNTTSKQLSGSASITTNGMLKVAGATSQSVTIKPNAEERVVFTILAQPSVGVSNVEVRASVGGETYTDKTEIAVRPISPLMKTTGGGTVQNNETKSVNLSANYMQGTMKGKLVVSRSPVVEFSKNLSELIGYPYGCVEQTTSKAFPQLYLADLSSSLSSMESNNAALNVQEAVNKLKTMQMYNGGLSYWQGGTYDSWWGSAYACHFMIEAKKAGYDVSQSTIDQIVQYLGKKIQAKDYYTYYYFDYAGTTKNRKVVPQEIFYSLYVMALAGKQDLATMNYYKGSIGALTYDSRYMLACTYLYLGDRKSYESLLPMKIEEYSQPVLGGSFSSWIRDEALILSVMIDVDPNNPQVNVMARHLSQQLKGRKWYSTQENSFSLLALGKVARKNGSSNSTAVITANGKKVGEMTGKDVVVKDNITGQNVSISAKNGNVYYYWEVSGISNGNDIKQEDNMMKIRRTYLDRFGKEVSGNTFRQNDMVVVKLSVSSLNGATLENVVLSDLLPAGFEIENPRITETPELSWATNKSQPDNIDYRDDRVNIFTTVFGQERVFYYVVRAVTPGVFKVGPAAADAMYNGDFHSYNGGGYVKIIQ